MSGSDRGHEIDEIVNIIINQAGDDTNWEDPEAAAAAFKSLNEGGWDQIIDSSIPSRDANIMKKASANLTRIKEEFGLTTPSDRLSAEERLEQQQRHLSRQIGEFIDQYGVEAVMDAVDDPDSAPPELGDFVADVLEEYPEDVIYDEVENDLKIYLDEIGRPHIPEDWAPEPEPILPDEVKQRIRQAKAEREAEILNQLERAWGMRFDDVEEFIDKMNRYIRAQGGTRRERATLRLKVYTDGDFSVQIDEPDRSDLSASEWEEWRKEAQRRFENTIPFDPAQVDTTVPVEIGAITLVAEGDDAEYELEGIDLTEARERFGTGAQNNVPMSFGGWEREQVTGEYIRYDYEGSVTGEGVWTTLEIYTPNEGESWNIEVSEYDEDDTAIIQTTIGDGIDDRARALEVAANYMQGTGEPTTTTEGQQRFTPEEWGQALQEINNRLGGGPDQMFRFVDDETFQTAAEAARQNADPDLLDQIRSKLEGLYGDEREDLQTYLANEMIEVEEDSDATEADRALWNFLQALPEYDPPEPRHPEAERPDPTDPEEIEGPRMVPNDERQHYEFIRQLASGSAPGESYRERLEGIIAALQTGEAEHSDHVPQDRLNELSVVTRELLKNELEDLLNDHLSEGASTEDFPRIQELVNRADSPSGQGPQRVQKLLDILRGNRPNEGDNTFPDDEFAALQQADDAREAFIDQLERRLEELRRGGTDQQRGRGSGREGYDTRTGSPGMDEDEFRDIQEGADRRRRDFGQNEPYDDRSRISGDTVRRDPYIERLFQDLARNIGQRQNILGGNQWEAYWRLTPSEQRRFYQHTPREWIQFWVRSGRTSLADLERMGFPPDYIPTQEDEDMASRPDYEFGRDYDEVDDEDLTPGERELRDLLDEDDGDQDDQDDEDDDQSRDSGDDSNGNGNGNGGRGGSSSGYPPDWF